MRSAGWVLGITLFIQAMVSMAVIAVPVMTPAMASLLSVQPTLIGAYVGLIYAAAMLSGLAAGALVKRFGAIRTSQACTLLCALGLAACAIPAIPAVLLGAVLIGLGYGPITPASSHLLAKTTPAHRMSLVFSLKQTGVPVGGVLAGVCVPVLLDYGIAATLLCVAAANLAAGLLAQPLRASLDADRSAREPVVMASLTASIRLVLDHPRLRPLAYCSFVYAIAQLSLTSFLVTYLHETLAYTLVAAGLLLSVSQFAGVGGRLAWGYVADRWLGAPRTLLFLTAVMALSAVTMALLSASMPFALLMAVVLVYGASAIGWNGVYLAEVAAQAPAGQAGVATGGCLAVTYFGVVVGPPLFGLIAVLSGSYRYGFLAVAIALTICMAILCRSPSHART